VIGRGKKLSDHGERLCLVKGEKGPVKLKRQDRIKEKRASGGKRALTLLAAVVLAISAYVLSQEVYFVRELLLFVACMLVRSSELRRWAQSRGLGRFECLEA